MDTPEVEALVAKYLTPAQQQQLENAAYAYATAYESVIHDVLAVDELTGRVNEAEIINQFPVIEGWLLDRAHEDVIINEGLTTYL